MKFIGALIIAYTCGGSSHPASLATLNGGSNISWTRCEYNYTANKTLPTLSFGVDGSPYFQTILDEVSVVNVVSPSVELLQNPGFDNSTTTPPIGWYAWCTSTCAAGSAGTIISSGCETTGNCYNSMCSNSGVDYLVQTFPATIGAKYTISFWYRRVKIINMADTTTIYVGIL